jgi:hypothetical protein
LSCSLLQPMHKAESAEEGQFSRAGVCWNTVLLKKGKYPSALLMSMNIYLRLSMAHILSRTIIKNVRTTVQQH